MFCSRCGVETTDDTNFCPSCGLDLAATTPIAAIRDRDAPDKTELDLVRDALKDEYDIEGELGRGGMAIVFHARERSLDREVALKVLPFSLSHDEEFVERFQREARTAAKLEHPNIIPIYRVGKTGNIIYFAMKYLRGKSLADVIREQGKLTPDEIRELLKQCASALGYASHHGIVHRDIKPDNIMYSDRGVAVVTDFGIAKAATGTKLTGTGMAIGTPYYMSPEQARAQKVDGRSDLYSLGVVAYQCLTGSVPFDGEDSFSIGYKHIMEELAEPELGSPDERAMFQIIRRMMAKDPADRYQDADQVVAALEGREIEATAPSPAPSVADAATVLAAAAPGVPTKGPAALSTPTTPMPQSLAPGEPKKKRSGVLVGAMALFIVGGLGGGGYFYTAVLGNYLPVISNLFGGPPVDPTSPIARVGDPEPGAAVGDSSQLAASDSAGQNAAAPGDSATAADSTTQDSVAVAEPEPEPDPPPPPA
ncbi:MAG: serine/threonine-protein kinase, partial [Gemmatimonadetes bacterium]|nr:serine/threonine-protein kinase [Gemmatimonadota bacterium]